MTLIDELRAASNGGGGGCSVCSWIDTQPNPNEWDAVMATDKSDIAHSVITRKMQSLGFSRKSYTPVAHHRRDRHRVAS